MEAHEGRLDWLIPVRVGRMIASPYAFLRGTAASWRRTSPRLPAPASPRSSAATRTWATSASTPRRSATWCSTSTTSTRRTPAAGSGTCAGWSPACGSPAGRTALERGRCADAVAPLRRGLPAADRGSSPSSRCSARSFERLDVDRLQATAPHDSAAQRRSSGPPSGPAPAPATGRCPASPSEHDGDDAAASSRSRR